MIGDSRMAKQRYYVTFTNGENEIVLKFKAESEEQALANKVKGYKAVKVTTERTKESFMVLEGKAKPNSQVVKGARKMKQGKVAQRYRYLGRSI